MNRSANRLSIVTTNLNIFSLANQRQFAKFAKLSPANLSRYMVAAQGELYSHTMTLKLEIIKFPLNFIAQARIASYRNFIGMILNVSLVCM